MSPEATRTPPLAHSCQCGARWGGANTAHCSASRSASFPLFTMGDGDAGLLAELYPHLYQSPVDAGRVMAEDFADLGGGMPIRVEPRRLLMPRLGDERARHARSSDDPVSGLGVMQERMLSSREGQKILWAVVGLRPVEVVDVIFSDDSPLSHPVLVGFEVLLPDAPAKPDVAVRGGVPARRAKRHLPATGDAADGDVVPGVPARAAKLLLSSAADRMAAGGARLVRHELILQVDTLCHRTFTAVGPFDLHRRNGACLEPEVVGLQLAVGRPYECWGGGTPEGKVFTPIR